MTCKFFSDYRWKEGVPIPINNLHSKFAYRIVTDPYKKRISIEKYQKGNFIAQIYDTYFLDFRFLKPIHQIGWEKEIIEETFQKTIYLIRNEDHRIILKEECEFKNDVCMVTKTYSPFGLLLAKHEFSYNSSGELNTSLLYDSNDHLVLSKKSSIKGAEYSLYGRIFI